MPVRNPQLFSITPSKGLFIRRTANLELGFCRHCGIPRRQAGPPCALHGLRWHHADKLHCRDWPFRLICYHRPRVNRHCRGTVSVPLLCGL